MQLPFIIQAVPVEMLATHEVTKEALADLFASCVVCIAFASPNPQRAIDSFNVVAYHCLCPCNN